MAINSVSSQSISDAPRVAIERARRDLVGAQVEVASGRHADVGLALGGGVRETLVARTQLADLNAVAQSSTIAAGRLGAAQLALGSIVSDAEKAVGHVLASRSNDVAQDVVVGLGGGFLDTFKNIANTQHNGGYVFGGVNVDNAPIADYFATPPSVFRNDVQNAFSSFFGFSSTDPSVESITPQQISDFLSGPLEALFSGSSWRNFSSASSSNLKDRISPDAIVESSTNTNEQAFRDIVKGYVMLSDLGADKFGQKTFEVLSDHAVLSLSSGVDGVGILQSQLGFVQERIETTQSVHVSIINRLHGQISSLESVDPYVAATNLTAITTQLEAAYSITARIQRLSILNFI